MIKFNSKTPRYSWLSCFSKHPIVDKKKAIWPTAEHAYQGHKTTDRAWRTAIRRADHPAQAKRMGGLCPLRPDWEKVKQDMMYRIQKAKFSQSEELRELLVATGNEQLSHEAPWDKFWGDGPDGHGKDLLAHIIMKVREEIVQEIADGVYDEKDE